MQIKPATKFKQYARVCFWGTSKQGKSHAALAIATAVVGETGRVGVISSEYGSTNLLSKKFPHDIIDLTVDDHGNPIANPFAPARYEEALELFVEQGYDAIVIDSLSHAWEGEGGVLERVNETINKFQDGWGKVGTPLYQHLMKTILSTKAHIFITIRAKDGYVLEPGKDGKMTPRNVGLKPVIRSSFGYEMQLTIRMDALVGHIDESAFQDEFPQGTQIVRPGEDVAYTLLQCLDGVPALEPTAESAEMRRLLDDLYALAPHVYAKYAQWEEMALRAALDIKEGPLPEDYTDSHIRLMQAYVEAKKSPARRQRQAVTEADPEHEAPADHEQAAPTQAEKLPASNPVATSPASPPAAPISLSEQIKEAKLRASSLGLATDAAEWANLLRTCKVTTIKSAADLNIVIAYMDQFEREQEASTTDTSSSLAMASEQQIVTLKKLCGYLNRDVPAELSTMTFQAAGKLIQELSEAYKEARSALPIR
jgi:hypothetical protein